MVGISSNDMILKHIAEKMESMLQNENNSTCRMAKNLEIASHELNWDEEKRSFQKILNGAILKNIFTSSVLMSHSPAILRVVIDVYFKVNPFYAKGIKVHLHCFHYGREQRRCSTGIALP
ncbi:MAG: hypothetical protein IPI23_08835 [Bacteroidetes bacterium]|nr:hypothetical protein [Bacteroidota bacterium]